MKVQNMTSARGNKIANQFMINDKGEEYFQSYESIIAKKSQGKIYLDEYYWDYSVTTGKYRNDFLGEKKIDTQRKIDSGEYILTDLNKWGIMKEFEAAINNEAINKLSLKQLKALDRLLDGKATAKDREILK